MLGTGEGVIDEVLPTLWNTA